MNEKILHDAPITHPLIACSLRAAYEAGNILLKMKKDKSYRVSLKRGKSPVTSADFESQKIILKNLSKFQYGFFSEEKKRKKSLPLHNVWMIDPLDGTADFIGGQSDYSVMISFMKKQKPILGVIYAPEKKLLSFSFYSKGSFFTNGKVWKKAQCKKTPFASTSKVLMSRHHLEEREKLMCKNLKVQSMEQMGSIGLKVGLIASGKADFYFTFTNRIKFWDTCAPFSILHEAGGVLSDLSGNMLSYKNMDFRHKNGVIAAANPILHKDIIGVFKAL